MRVKASKLKIGDRIVERGFTGQDDIMLSIVQIEKGQVYSVTCQSLEGDEINLVYFPDQLVEVGI